jgi:RNA polymerase sigma-70 factor (sigma-E family)
VARRAERDREFAAYVAARSPQLLRTAYLLCGDRHRAEDLVQVTLTKLYVAWERVEKRDALDAYARQAMVRASGDESRRPWRRREVPSGDDRAAVGGSAVFDELRRLPPRQRAAVVLRYWNDLSVEETATLMGCSANAVKTHAARGLAKLRVALAAPGDAGTNQAATRGAHE